MKNVSVLHKSSFELMLFKNVHVQSYSRICMKILVQDFIHRACSVLCTCNFISEYSCIILFSLFVYNRVHYLCTCNLIPEYTCIVLFNFILLVLNNNVRVYFLCQNIHIRSCSD